MRAADLDIHELLAFLPDRGTITFAGERVLLLDAVRLGSAQEGADRHARIDSRAGGAHSIRICARVARGRDAAQRVSVGHRRGVEGRGRAPAHHSGHCPGGSDPQPRYATGSPGAEGNWHESYEAEQHLLHLGQADEPVCWTLDGIRERLHVLRLRQGDHRD